MNFQLIENIYIIDIFEPLIKMRSSFSFIDFIKFLKKYFHFVNFVFKLRSGNEFKNEFINRFDYYRIVNLLLQSKIKYFLHDIFFFDDFIERNGKMKHMWLMKLYQMCIRIY